MKLPEMLTGKIQIVWVWTGPGECFRTILFIRKKGYYTPVATERIRADLPLFVLVSGEGILTKEYRTGEEGIGRITENPDLWYEREKLEGDRLLLRFMRREKLDRFLQAQVGVQVDGLRFFEGKEADFLSSAPVFSAFVEALLEQEFSLKRLLQPDEGGVRLVNRIFRRLRLPVLGVWLGILLLNFGATSWLEERSQEQQRLWAEQQRLQKGRSRENERIRELTAKIREREIVGCALLLDRLAHCVPEAVSLSALTLAPLTEKVKSGKLPQTDSGIVLLEGETLQPVQINRFCERLAAESFCKEVRLTGMKQIKESKNYRFEIEVELKRRENG